MSLREGGKVVVEINIPEPGPTSCFFFISRLNISPWNAHSGVIITQADYCVIELVRLYTDTLKRRMYLQFEELTAALSAHSLVPN